MTDDRISRNDVTQLTSDDKRMIEALRSQTNPGERTTAQRARFELRLRERLEGGSRFEWRPILVTAGAAFAAVALWLSVSGSTPELEETDLIAAVAEPASSLLAYAYYETDYLASIDLETEFLSEEYQAIATAFEVP